MHIIMCFCLESFINEIIYRTDQKVAKYIFKERISLETKWTECLNNLFQTTILELDSTKDRDLYKAFKTIIEIRNQTAHYKLVSSNCHVDFKVCEESINTTIELIKRYFNRIAKQNPPKWLDLKL